MSIENVAFNGAFTRLGYASEKQQERVGYSDVNQTQGGTNVLSSPWNVIRSTAAGVGIQSVIISGPMATQDGQLCSIINHTGTGLVITLNTGLMLLSSSVTSTGTNVIANDTTAKYILDQSLGKWVAW
jgi:hypothetical protein